MSHEITKELLTMYSTQRKTDFHLESGEEYDVLSFESPFQSGDKKVDTARALVFKPQERKKEAVLFLHGTGQRNFDPLTYYPRYLSKNGYVTVMPVLPYHFERTPEGKQSGLAFVKGNDVQLAFKFAQAVTDMLTCIDFLEKEGFQSVNIMGFSFGGMISAITMALDKRVKKGAFVVTGGNYEYITWKSLATRVLRISYEEDESCTPQKCHLRHQIFDKIAEKFNTLEDLLNLPVCFSYDPSIFARLIPPRKTLFFKALFDVFIPSASSNDLWKKLGKPKRYVFPSGHLSAHLLFKKFIAKKSLEFFEAG